VVKRRILYLAFFGDGPKWDNFVLTTALPRGMSNGRPFRYGDHRIAQDVLRDMQSDDGRRALTEETAVLAARFGAGEDASGDIRWQLLPLRKVQITLIDYSRDNNSVHFRVGPFFDFSSVGDIRDALVPVPDSERATLGPHTILFRSAAEPRLPECSDKDERAVWARLCDLLSRASSPVRDEAKRSVYVFLQTPLCKKCEPASVEKLAESQVKGPQFGWELVEGKSYELPWNHRIPALIGTNHSFQRIDLCATSSTPNLEIADAKASLTSNYERHGLTVTAKGASGAYETLSLIPTSERTTDSAGNAIYVVDVKVPLRIKKSIWYRFKTSIATTGGMILALYISLLGEQLTSGGLPLVKLASVALALVLLRFLEQHFRQ
jgi:hypothetical protein